MSGIVGLWNLDGQPIARELLARLSMAIAHRGPDGEGMHIQSSVGVACQNLQVTPESIGEIQPLVHPSGLVIAFDGRLDNREEILLNLEHGATKSNKISDAALILAAYRLYGEDLPARLNGDYALAIYDPERQMLLLVRDVIGVRPLYYYLGNDLFIFASEIKALLTHPNVSTRPNDKALASLLVGGDPGYGGFKGNTFFEGIFSVPPGCALVITTSGYRVKQYWDFDSSQLVRFGSFQEYAEAFHQLFKRAVQRRTRSAFPVAVSVSGGLDSSAIYCQAERLRRENDKCWPSILGYSWVYKDGSPADEKEFIDRIEQEYRVEIQKILITSGSSFQIPIKMMWHSETPLLISNQSDLQIFHNRVRNGKAKVILTGHWGDQVLFSMAYLIDLFHRFEWAKVFHHLEEYPRWMTDANPSHFTKRTFCRNMLRYHIPEGYMRVWRKIRRDFYKREERQNWYTKKLQDLAQQSEKKYSSPVTLHASAHFKSFYEMIKSSYYVLCLEENNKIASLNGLEMAYPFLDRDLVVFLMNIPGEVLADNGRPKALLRQSMQGILPDAIVDRRGKANFTNEANESMEKDFVQLANIFQRGELAIKYGYVKNELLSSELMDLNEQIHIAKDAVLLWKLEKLFGLELWLEIFFGKKSIQL